MSTTFVHGRTVLALATAIAILTGAAAVFAALVAPGVAPGASTTMRQCLPAPRPGTSLYVGAVGPVVDGGPSKAIQVAKVVPRDGSSIAFGSSKKNGREANAVSIAGSNKYSKLACIRLRIAGPPSHVLAATLPDDPDGDGTPGCGPKVVGQKEMNGLARFVRKEPNGWDSGGWIENGCPDD